MRPLYVVTQTVCRYDCLRVLLESCERSTRRPNGIFIVDHGYNSMAILNAIEGVTTIPTTIVTLRDPGCAHNGNWFIQNVPDDRVACGDDVMFEPDALEKLANAEGDFVIPYPTLNPCACVLIRSSCVEKVAAFDRQTGGEFLGLFDEKISPGYLYFDDTDYVRRMNFAGVKQTMVPEARVAHQNGGSQTHQRTIADPVKNADHHRRFGIASANYSWKWGGPPFAETLTTPRAWPRPKGWGGANDF